MYPSRIEEAFGGDFLVTANGTGDVLDGRCLSFPAVQVGAGVANTASQGRILVPFPHRVRGLSYGCSGKTAVSSVDPTIDLFATLAAPDAAPTLALSAVAGNIENGAHGYAYTFVNSAGETTPSPVASITVVDKTAAGKVAVGIEIGPAGTTARKVYRTAAAGSALLLLATVANNTAVSYLDNIADASLTTAAPVANTSAKSILSAAISLSAPDVPLRARPVDPVSIQPGGVVYSLRAVTGASTGAIADLTAFLEVERCASY